MENLQETLLNPLLSLLANALAALAVAVVVKYLQKLGVEVKAEQRATLETIAKQTILRIEELAMARAKAGGSPWSAQEKLVRAVDAIEIELPKVPREDIVKMVHATLPAVGLGAAGDLVPSRALAYSESLGV